MRTAPPPKILIIDKGWVEGIYFKGLQFIATDMEGIGFVTVENFGSALGSGSSVQTFFNEPPYPRYLKPFVFLSVVKPGSIITRITLQNKNNQMSKVEVTFNIEAPKPPEPPEPPIEYPQIVMAFASDNNISLENANTLFNGIKALDEGGWWITWYGSIETRLNPTQCKNMYEFATAATVIDFIPLSLSLAGILNTTWYVDLILSLIFVQLVQVRAVMDDCAKHNANGILGWNALTGIFYARKE